MSSTFQQVMHTRASPSKTSPTLGGNDALSKSLPLDLIAHSFSFVAVEELLRQVQFTSKFYRDVIRTIVGVREEGKVYQGIPGLRFDPFLFKRYDLLISLRSHYSTLQDPDMALNRLELLRGLVFGGEEGYPEQKPRPNTFKSLELLCNNSSSRFESIVTVDDKEIQNFLGIGVLEYKCKPVTFVEFVELHDLVNGIMKKREEFLYKHFMFLDETESPRKRARRQRRNGERRSLEDGKLTAYGLEVCNRIFDFFDIDDDDHLGWEELSAINQAAGLPLSRSAFVWVQNNYDTGIRGRLTRKGYKEMFLENFLRVARLMYKDLIKLQQYMENTNHEELRRTIRSSMEQTLAAESDTDGDDSESSSEDGVGFTELVLNPFHGTVVTITRADQQNFNITQQIM